MSKLKVGDRVRFVTASPLDEQIIAAKVGEIAEVVEVKEYGEFPIHIRFSDGKSEWMASIQLRRLVKRKRPKPTAPDRAMMAARLLAGMLANPSGPIQGNEQNGWDYVNCSAESLSQVALELADALIAEGAK